MALIVGSAAGFLELAVGAVQLRGLHRLGWRSLQINRHAAWMVPLAECLVTVPLGCALTLPALGIAGWRSRGRGGLSASSWVWGWSGVVLGTLLLLGPLLAIPNLHPLAAHVLAMAGGVKLRRFVRPSPAWRRGVVVGGASVIAFLPALALTRVDGEARASDRGWTRPAVRAPSLIWIVLDTVRADRMSLYGYERPTTPELERWARRAITFNSARAAAPWTLPSHLTMFTGLWPFEHGARVDRPYHGSAPTLAEHLGAQGYLTGGIAANVRMCNTSYGVGRGFDHYIDYPCNREVSPRATMCSSTLGLWALRRLRALGLPAFQPFPLNPRRTASEIVAEGREWLDRVRRRNVETDPGSPRPFFLFLNVMDVHGPYFPDPERPGETFWTGPIPPREQACPRSGWTALQTFETSGPADRPLRQRELEETSRRLGDLYDECLRGLDARLGRFLDTLQADGLLEDTWVVVTGDHGENLGERGRFGHGSNLYNELTHVPLLLIPPLASKDHRVESTRGRRIDVPVSHRDLPRTMVDLLLPGTGNPFPGRSLARHWNGKNRDPGGPDPVLSQLEEQPLDGEDVRSDHVLTMDSILVDDHLLVRSSNGPTELFQLSTDRDLTRDLASLPATRPRRQQLEAVLDAILQSPVRRN